jgi:hypothetical protein
MLVLIGRSWLDAVDDDGRRRLEDPRDWVVQEIEAALARDVTVIPVLVDGARMPTPAELPPALESLGFRQAISLRHESFATDIGILVSAIEQAVPTGAEAATGLPRDRNVEQRLVNALAAAVRRGPHSPADWHTQCCGRGMPRPPWPAVVAFLVAVSALLVSAVQLS